MKSDVKVEIAGREDAHAILELQRIAYQSEAEIYQDWSIPPLTESLQELLAEFDRQVFLKGTDGNSLRLIGSVRVLIQNNVCHIGRLIVHPDFRRQGIGSLLMHEVERRFSNIPRLELFTGHLSNGNLHFYQKLGYLPYREQKLSDKVTLVFLQKDQGCLRR